MKKPTNHLASRAERLASFKFPHQEQINHLNQLTATIRQAWQAILPSNMLDTLQVIADDGNSLTISTDNHTLANHLTYSRQPLLQELHQQQLSLHCVSQLKFRVIAPLGTEVNNVALQSNQPVNNVTSCELSEFTKQNITQVMSLVTDDIALQRVLQKFLKE